MEELNKILRVLINRTNIYLSGSNSILNSFYEQYGNDYKGGEVSILLTNIQQIKKYNMEILELCEMIEKLNVPVREQFVTYAPAIVSLFNDIKGFKSEAKIGNTLVVASQEELRILEYALKSFLNNTKGMINQEAPKPMNNLDIFKEKAKKYDNNSYFTQAIIKLRAIASKEKRKESVISAK